MLPKAHRSSDPSRVRSEPNCGLYLLLMRMNSPLTLIVGARGEIAFQPGRYVYCGSARRNLSHRISRHMSREKKRRWHIDYLTCREEISVDSVFVFSVDGLTECRLNSSVQRLPGARPIERFGCSDCKCSSHLTFLGEASLPTHINSHITYERV
ncbi:MAG: GIY-YIG nuclease family protein [Candidatus Abyssobacteria bacterium SURF_17]|jgi:sugar fermentation stimulation protein A|uniref:GIY-YIG nuclease family protein n=1 Tax=Candidatus Abyssobacteria bacterium SURF_17 TaxID=2093361 RepID=A0A419F1S0_9BACT|nr:MAG: GIY-YIG nuclease family protein [Candidatus Abyssubacteria bacterium SURF_17]